MRLANLFAIGFIGSLTIGCHGIQNRPVERKLSAPSGLKWVKIVANGIE